MLNKFLICIIIINPIIENIEIKEITPEIIIVLFALFNFLLYSLYNELEHLSLICVKAIINKVIVVANKIPIIP